MVSNQILTNSGIMSIQKSFTQLGNSMVAFEYPFGQNISNTNNVHSLAEDGFHGIEV